MMEFKPHAYQQYAIDFIKAHKEAAVFLDMGLGKTVVCLSAILDLMYDSFEVEKVLVIAPKRVARDVWPAELKKWSHLSLLTYAVAVGSKEERRAALTSKADIYIINRENVDWLINDSGLPFDYDMVVIDELSSFKSYRAKRWKALMQVRPKVKRIVGLTGTPSSNGLMDLYAEFRILDMGKRLGRFIGQYREKYFVPDKRNAQVVFSYKLRPGAEEKIYQKISDMTISMKSGDYLQMPEKVSTAYPVYLSEKEQRTYAALKKDLVLELPDGEVTASNAAALTGKLCQMANGAIYGDDGSVIRIHERKLEGLEDIIESMNGRPILVAYWFKHDLERIAERLQDRKIPFRQIDTSDSIREWNAGKVPVGLIHPASAGHGLNLQAGGSAIVWFSLPWSLEYYQQTNTRLWRQGQKAETVVIQHIITQGSIDEDILRALEGKSEMQEALIDAVKANLGR